MGAPDVLQHLARLGIRLSLEGLNVRAEPKAAITPAARALIRQHKGEIVEALQEGEHLTPSDERVARMIGKLDRNSGLRYAIETHDDVEPDAVILTVAIRGKGACELRIPKSRYDAFALLELIEKQTTPETLQ